MNTLILGTGCQFDIKVRGFTGPFCVQSTSMDLLEFTKMIARHTFLYAETFNGTITIRVDSIEAVSGPNKPFPIAACGERVRL